VIFNKFFPTDDMLDYNLDYTYYHREIMKLVNDITHQTTKIMKKTSGTMFDELDE